MEYKIGAISWLLLVLRVAWMLHSRLLIAVKDITTSVKSEAKYDDCYTVEYEFVASILLTSTSKLLLYYFQRNIVSP